MTKQTQKYLLIAGVGAAVWYWWSKKKSSASSNAYQNISWAGGAEGSAQNPLDNSYPAERGALAGDGGFTNDTLPGVFGTGMEGQPNGDGGAPVGGVGQSFMSNAFAVSNPLTASAPKRLSIPVIGSRGATINGGPTASMFLRAIRGE